MRKLVRAFARRPTHAMKPHEWGTRCMVATIIVVFLCCLSVSSQEPAKQVIWRFDDTASLGGHATKVLGHPKVIETPMGKAIAFNGVDDALFAGVHPLAGAETWTWEMIFKPDRSTADERSSAPLH